MHHSFPSQNMLQELNDRFLHTTSELNNAQLEQAQLSRTLTTFQKEVFFFGFFFFREAAHQRSLLQVAEDLSRVRAIADSKAGLEVLSVRCFAFTVSSCTHVRSQPPRTGLVDRS